MKKIQNHNQVPEIFIEFKECFISKRKYHFHIVLRTLVSTKKICKITPHMYFSFPTVPTKEQNHNPSPTGSLTPKPDDQRKIAQMSPASISLPVPVTTFFTQLPSLGARAAHRTICRSRKSSALAEVSH